MTSQLESSFLGALVSRLRANVAFSALAMVVVGVVRPLFNAVVTYAFGPEINGRAAVISSLFFLASLPATAALPIVMVRQVSRAIGRGEQALGRSIAQASSQAALALTLVGTAGAAIYGLFRLEPPATSVELGLVVVGTLGYTYWRVARSLLLAVGQAQRSLTSDLIAALATGITLAVVVIAGRPEWAVAALVATYLGYTVASLPWFWREASGDPLPPEEKTELIRYNLLWFVGTTASLAAREVCILLLEARVPAVEVGEASLALSILLALALAPRIIELPLIHELAALGGSQHSDRQRALTELALHWMTIVSLGIGFGLAILAGPILSTLGRVQSPAVVVGFGVVCLAFALEMIATPATNLLVAEAPPTIFTTTGVVSLFVAAVWWLTPWGQDTFGILLGLAASFVVKSIGIAAYASHRFRLRLFQGGFRKLVLCILGGVAAWASLSGEVDPIIVAPAFYLGFAVLFGGETWRLAARVWSPHQKAA